MKRNALTWTAALVAMVSALVVVAGAGKYAGPDYSSDTGLRSIFFPKTEIVTVVGTRIDPLAGIGRRQRTLPAVDRLEDGLFDSTTGAVYTLRGNRANSSARVHWELAIPGVRDSSGLLALRDIEDGSSISLAQGIVEIRDAETYLLDLVTGNTWLFRLRTGSNQQLGTWDPIQVYERGGNKSVADMLTSR